MRCVTRRAGATPSRLRPISPNAHDHHQPRSSRQSFQKLTGYDRPELTGRNCRLLQGPEPDLATIARIRAAVAAGTDISIDVQEPQGRHDFLERAL